MVWFEHVLLTLGFLDLLLEALSSSSFSAGMSVAARRRLGLAIGCRELAGLMYRCSARTIAASLVTDSEGVWVIPVPCWTSEVAMAGRVGAEAVGLGDAMPRQVQRWA